jgi:hypothetical protein
MCGRCFDEVAALFPANCIECPEDRTGALGMYHCPECGAMLLAGTPHPEMCARCLKREHPLFDERTL